TAVRTSKHTQHMTPAIRRERIDHIRVRRGERETRAPELVGRRQPLRKMDPRVPEIGAAPNSVVGPVRLNRYVEDLLILRMHQHAVAVIAAPAPIFDRIQSTPANV